jgi:hypothetical protein
VAATSQAASKAEFCSTYHSQNQLFQSILTADPQEVPAGKQTVAQLTELSKVAKGLAASAPTDETRTDAQALSVNAGNTSRATYAMTPEPSSNAFTLPDDYKGIIENLKDLVATANAACE